MAFGQTVAEQRFVAMLQGSLPRIAGALERIAAAMETSNELAKQGQVMTGTDPAVVHEALQGVMLKAMGRTPHDKREESANG